MNDPGDWDGGDYDDDGDCPNCGGEGYTWGCFECTCACDDDDGLGCAPIRCDWCKPPRQHPPTSASEP